MKWTSLNDLREKYLSFFESKGHLRLPSFPLVPINDKSLLLINSGMAPMKKFFTGEETPPRLRVTTCQKCIRTPDLDRVGHTARHGTYFEMLGNFSFGDYFKDKAIPWAWEFMTVTLEIPADLLWPSVYEKDDESFELWKNVVGVPEEKIVRLGKADNFWEHGSGPCGPCSEVYFDRGEKYGCGSEDCRPGCDCDRFMEIWNNVFTQFNSDGKGNYTELASKNIDTGMGLERLACIMQGVDGLFEVDSVRKILDTVTSVAGKKYGENKNNDVSIRVVTDHIRGATFMICDGVIPSNEGRGYVLRRLLRRALRHGKLLGITRPFLAEICEVVIGENRDAYPEVEARREYILKVVCNEEESFYATISSGLAILNRIMKEAIISGKKIISGEDAFKLYDTFGFPVDLTKEIIGEHSLEIDEDAFGALMQEQKNRARAARGNISGWDDNSKNLIKNIKTTEFLGYETLISQARVVAVFVENEDGTASVDEACEGDFTVVLDRTPFYGEGGGQVGDIGEISGENLLLTVTDTKKTDGVYLHLCSHAGGTVRVGDTVTAAVDPVNRQKIMRAHSSCHLLQAALKEVLGNHVEQAGSYVEGDHARFDFTHFAALTAEEIKRVEDIVNSHILSGAEIKMVQMPIAEAKKLGAVAIFGEKYGDIVRVVSMGDVSVEFCGGTHADNTAKIGLFKIVSEASVAAGVRRIEALTGLGVLGIIEKQHKLITDTAGELKTPNVNDISKRAAQLSHDLSDMKKELDSLNSKLAATKLDGIMANAADIKGISFVSAALDMKLDTARSLADEIKARYDNAAALLAVTNDGKINLIAVCGKTAVARGAHAGKLVAAVAKETGGRGGGRPDNAMAGVADPSKLPAALALAPALLGDMV